MPAHVESFLPAAIPQTRASRSMRGSAGSRRRLSKVAGARENYSRRDIDARPGETRSWPEPPVTPAALDDAADDAPAYEHHRHEQTDDRQEMRVAALPRPSYAKEGHTVAL